MNVCLLSEARRKQTKQISLDNPVHCISTLIHHMRIGAQEVFSIATLLWREALWFGFQNPPLAARSFQTESRPPAPRSHATSCSSSSAFRYHDGCWQDILEISSKNERRTSRQRWKRWRWTKCTRETGTGANLVGSCINSRSDLERRSGKF